MTAPYWVVLVEPTGSRTEAFTTLKGDINSLEEARRFARRKLSVYLDGFCRIVDDTGALVEEVRRPDW